MGLHGVAGLQGCRVAGSSSGAEAASNSGEARHLLGEGVALVVPAAPRGALAPRTGAREGLPLDKVLPPPRHPVGQREPRLARLTLHPHAGGVGDGRVVSCTLGGRLARTQVDHTKELPVAKVVGVRDLRLGTEFRHEHLERSDLEATRAEGGLDRAGDVARGQQPRPDVLSKAGWRSELEGVGDALCRLHR